MESYDEITNYFTIVSLILLIFPTYTFFGSYFQTLGLEKKSHAYLEGAWREYGVAEVEKQLLAPKVQPDIYYIILDGYLRSDILEDVYGYDNSSFQKKLKDQGFYVALESRSNYAHTAFSLGSSMNMVYLDKMPATLTEGFYTNKENLIKNTSLDIFKKNKIMDVFKSQEYELVSFDTGFGAINFPESDYYMAPESVTESVY